MSTASVARLSTRALRGVTTELVNVTPDMARKFLTANTSNRRIRQARVDQLARDMMSGRFEFNGETIQIAKDGTILNGQHRLTAVATSGCNVPLLIVKGLPSEAQETIDIGAKRTVGDSLQLRGETNALNLASIARRALMWDAGYRTNAGGRFVPSDSEVREYLEANPSVRLATDVAIKGRTRIAVAPSVIGLAFYVCDRIDHAAAKEFYIDQVINGIGLFPGDAAMAFRNLLVKQKDERSGRIAETDVLGYLLRAWNAYRKNERATKLQAPKGGWNSTNIPDPI